MKRLLLFIFFLVTICSKAQTWVYHQFPDSSAIWNIHFVANCPSTGNTEEYYSITISGDTLINSQTYHKLSTPFIETIAMAGSCLFHLPGYRGAVRQDTILKKVFYVPPSDSLENLLYDFNMQVGDTVKGYLETLATPIDTIQSIDSVIVGSSFRKRWNLSSYYNIHFIEGVGSTYGLIEKSPGSLVDQANYSVICFKQNNFTLYPSISSSCELITSMNSNESKIDKINIFPNPSSTSFNIDFGETLNIIEIQLTNLLGKIILKQTIDHQTNYKINSLKNGIYILTLISKEGIRINRKIISSP